MNARLATLLRAVWHALNISAGLLGAALAGALAFALFTPAGAELVLREVRTQTAGMIDAQGISGRLWGPLRIERLRITLEAVDIDIEQAEFDARLPQLLRGRLAVESLSAASVAVRIKPTPPKPPEDAITRLPFDLLVRRARVAQLRVTPIDAEAIVIERIALSANWIADRVVVRQLAAHTPWVGALRLDGVARLFADAVEVTPLHIEGFAVARLEGRFGYGTASDLQLVWQRASWPPLTDDGAEFDSGGGRARWRGTFDDYQFEARGGLVLPQLAMKLDSSGHGSLQGLTLERLKLAALDGTLNAKAVIDWRDGLRIDGEARVLGVRPEGFDAAWPGLINAEVRAQTTVRDGVPDLRFSAVVKDSKLRGYPLALDASGRYVGKVLSLTTLRAQSGRVLVTGSGQVLPSLDASAEIDAADLRDAWPALSGRLKASVQARGPLRLPALRATISADQLHYQTYALEQLRVRADLDPAAALDAEVSLQNLDAGTRIDQARLAVQGPVADHRITFSVESAEGRASLLARGALDHKTPAWRGELSEGKLAPRQLAAWTLAAPTAVQIQREPTIAPMCWQSETSRACAALTTLGARRRIELSLKDFALEYLRPLLPDGAQLSATLQATASAEFGAEGLRDLHAEFSTGPGRWQLRGLSPVDLAPAQLSINDDPQGTRIEAKLPIAKGEVALDARLAPGAVFTTRALSGTLRAELPDLSWLPQFSLEVADADGRISGALQLAGTLATPSAQGRLTLRDGRIRLITPGIELREVGVRIDAAGAEPLRVAGEARSDGGQIRIAGSVNPWHTPLALDLKLDGEDFQALKISDARAWVSPNLQLRLADDLLRVSGTVTVPRAAITPKSLGDNSVPVSGDEVLVGKDPGAQRPRDLHTEADILISLGDDVRFQGFGLKSKLKGTVQAFENPGLPTRARGEIRLIDGEYKAYGQDLKIETGRLIFTGGAVTTPALEIRATRKPTDEITVGLYVRGTLKEPDFKVFSTPPMPQEQQLGWLILGRPIRDSSSASDKAMVGNAATSLGLAGGEWIAGRLGSKIGIDEVSVGSRPGEPTEQAMFTVGKYLSPKLFIAYGVGLFQPGQTFRMQYELGGGFKVRTETGVQSGGDILYSVERK